MKRINIKAGAARVGTALKSRVGIAGILATGVAVAGIGFGTSADAASTLPANSVGSAQIVAGGVWGGDIQNNTIPWSKLGWDLRQQILKAQDASGQDGKSYGCDGKVVDATHPAATCPGTPGTNGTNGDDAILSVTAASALVDRPDSGLHGTWAKDNMTRTVTITRQKAAKASNCGGGATKCWFYTGSIVDNGSFTTVAGGKSPQAGADIAGTVTGTVAGASQIEFFASSDAPDPSKVDPTVTGAAHPTGEWVKMFFPTGTVLTDTDLLDWSWTYTAPGTCEKWVNAKAGNTGDIAGVNAC